MTVTTIHPAAATDNAVAASDGTDATVTAVRPDGTAGAVWDALTANPDATTMAIATAAGVSRASATKALTAMEAAGQVIRTPGTGTGRNRTGDTWAAVTAVTVVPAADQESADDHAADPQDTPAADDLTEDGPATDDPAPVTVADEAPSGGPATGTVIDLQNAMKILEAEADLRARTAEELARVQAEEAERRARIDAELRRAYTKEETRRALADLLATVTTTYAALIADDEAAVNAGLEKIGVEAATARRAARTTAVRPTTSNGARKPSGDRSAPRPLRPLVEEHLTAHPGKEFTAGEIARVLDRSPGAVANALDTLAAHGDAELTCEHPRRFRATGTGGHTTEANDADDTTQD